MHIQNEGCIKKPSTADHQILQVKFVCKQMWNSYSLHAISYLLIN